MKFLHLNPDVSFCTIGGRSVFLDIGRNRYLALDPAAEAAFDRFRQSRHPAAGTDPDTARLLATKLFTLADNWQPILPVDVEIPDRELTAPSSAPPLRPFDVLEIWMLIARARRALSRHALKPLLEALKRHRLAVTAPVPAVDTAGLAGRFRKARALVPIAPSCLQDSIALGIWLARRSSRPTIVFGVKLDPFAAHCWVQTEAAILNDAPDTVSQFAPVLVIL